MASALHDDLDELDEDPPFEIIVEEPPPKKKLLPQLSFDVKVSFKPILIGLLVLLLGGGLGGIAYLVMNYDTRDLIGLLDIGESPPKLSMALPGLGDGLKGSEPAKQPMGGGLLTPPGTVAGSSDRGGILKGIPDDTPPADAPPAPPVTAKAEAEAPTPPAPDPAMDELAKLEAASARPAAKPAAPPPPPTATATAQEAAAAIPSQPNPRSAEKQPPSFESLTAPKAELKPLIAAPVKDLQRKTQAGDLPYPGPDGRQPWQVYSRPWSGPADKGKVAVVVVDLGLDKAATEAAIAKLPPEVTLAFSPYAPSLDKWIKKARDFGHEVLLGLPAEGPGYPSRDPGPYGLLTSLSPEANLVRLETVMAKAAGYAGLISLGTTYGASPAVSATMAALREHGLMYLGDGNGPPAQMPAMAPITAVADSDPFKEAIDMRLNQVSIQARTKGQAIAVISARPLSFIRVMAWINDLEGQNLVLAPASTLAQQLIPAGKS